MEREYHQGSKGQRAYALARFAAGLITVDLTSWQTSNQTHSVYVSMSIRAIMVGPAS
jgi:hypothetical protein